MTPISTMSIMSRIATSATPKFGMERLNPTRGLAVPELDRLALVGRPGGATGPISGAGEPAGVVGSRVAGGHHEVTRSAFDPVRRRAESGAQGRRLGGGPDARTPSKVSLPDLERRLRGL
jgi:hypothetical protein